MDDIIREYVYMHAEVRVEGRKGGEREREKYRCAHACECGCTYVTTHSHTV